MDIQEKSDALFSVLEQALNQALHHIIPSIPAEVDGKKVGFVILELDSRFEDCPQLCVGYGDDLPDNYDTGAFPEWAAFLSAYSDLDDYLYLLGAAKADPGLRRLIGSELILRCTKVFKEFKTQGGFSRFHSKPTFLVTDRYNSDEDYLYAESRWEQLSIKFQALNRKKQKALERLAAQAEKKALTAPQPKTRQEKLIEEAVLKGQSLWDLIRDHPGDSKLHLLCLDKLAEQDKNILHARRLLIPILHHWSWELPEHNKLCELIDQKWQPILRALMVKRNGVQGSNFTPAHLYIPYAKFFATWEEFLQELTILVVPPEYLTWRYLKPVAKKILGEHSEYYLRMELEALVDRLRSADAQSLSSYYNEWFVDLEKLSETNPDLVKEATLKILESSQYRGSHVMLTVHVLRFVSQYRLIEAYPHILQGLLEGDLRQKDASYYGSAVSTLVTLTPEKAKQDFKEMLPLDPEKPVDWSALDEVQLDRKSALLAGRFYAGDVNDLTTQALRALTDFLLGLKEFGWLHPYIANRILQAVWQSGARELKEIGHAFAKAQFLSRCGKEVQTNPNSLYWANAVMPRAKQIIEKF